MYGIINVTPSSNNKDEEIGVWSIQRIGELTDKENPEEEVHEYEWYVTRKRLNGGVDKYEGKLTHRYGDGWIVLMYKVFGAATAEEALAKVPHIGE